MSSFVAGTVIGLSVVSAVFASVADAGDARLLLLTSAILLLVVGTALLLTAPAARGGHGRSAHRALKDALVTLVTVRRQWPVLLAIEVIAFTSRERRGADDCACSTSHASSARTAGRLAARGSTIRK